MSATRYGVKVRNIKDAKEELDIALSRLKKKMKETGTLMEYLDRQHYRRPAERRKEKARKALARKFYDAKNARRKKKKQLEQKEVEKVI